LFTLVAKNVYKLHYVNMSAYVTAAPTGWIFLKLGIGVFCDNLSSNSKLG